MRRSSRIAQKTAQKRVSEEVDEDDDTSGPPRPPPFRDASTPTHSSSGDSDDDDDEESKSTTPAVIVTPNKKNRTNGGVDSPSSAVPSRTKTMRSSGGTSGSHSSNHNVVDVWIQCSECLQWQRQVEGGKKQQDQQQYHHGVPYHCGCRVPADKSAACYFVCMDSPSVLMELHVKHHVWEADTK
eukprot:PhF_6_TR6791/c0_g1_i1/m.9774